MSQATNQFFDLSHFALLEVSGDDANDFLQNQLTVDVKNQSADNWSFGAWCQPKGRAICTFIFFQRPGAFYLMLPAMLRDRVMQRLNMFVLRSAVQIKDVSENYAMLGLSGDSIGTTLNSIGIDAAGGNFQVSQADDVAVLGLWNEHPRCIVICPIDKLTTLTQRIKLAFREADRSTWSLLDIRAGIPWITESISETFIPQMLNLDKMQGLSFRKGCYPGQEVISRLHFRGQLKRQLYLGEGEGPVTPGAGDQLEDIESGKLAGDIVDAERDGDGRFYCLAVVDIADAENHSLRLRGEGDTPVSLSPLHYPEPA